MAAAAILSACSSSATSSDADGDAGGGSDVTTADASNSSPTTLAAPAAETAAPSTSSATTTPTDDRTTEDDQATSTTTAPSPSAPDGTEDGAVEGGTDSGAVGQAAGQPDAIYSTVAPQTTVVAEPEAIENASTSGDSTGSDPVSVRLVSSSAIEVVTELPGEIGGPAVQLELEVDNRADEPVDLDAVTVALEYGDARPATEVTTDPADPFTGSLAAGEQAVGQYVFTVPPAGRESVDIFVTIRPDLPIVHLTGNLTNA